MLNNLTKLMKKFNATGFASFQQSTGVSIKNFGQYKKLPSEKIMKKKKTFNKIFCSM